MKITLVSVLDTLSELYSPPKSFLHWETPLDLLVATMLSARCTDEQVNKTTKNLFKKYRTCADYLRVDRSELEQDIFSCGTYKNKARFIQEMCAQLVSEHEGEVPLSMEELIALSGVGRKTASIVLYAAFGINEGIAVDTHVFRVARRLGLSDGTTPERVEKDLMKQAPRERWGEVNTLLICHGREVWTGRDRKCKACVFREKCPGKR